MKTRTSLLALAACLVLGHAHAAEPASPAALTTRAPAAPWSARALSPKSVPAVYASEWKKAKNRGRCASLALKGADKQAGIKVRRADFSDGWAVAYDLPGQRSAFGIAGTGVDVDSGGSTYKFPHTLTWADGSQANYGLRGGTGPGYLAYLQVAGQRCLYNVWSERSQEHLEQLLRSLRRVKTP